jgi:hypothetical protein
VLIQVKIVWWVGVGWGKEFCKAFDISLLGWWASHIFSLKIVWVIGQAKSASISSLHHTPISGIVCNKLKQFCINIQHLSTAG